MAKNEIPMMTQSMRPGELTRAIRDYGFRIVKGVLVTAEHEKPIRAENGTPIKITDNKSKIPGSQVRTIFAAMRAYTP